MNKSLLAKWNWRLATEDNPPWKKLIKIKYGLEAGEWFSEEPKESFGVGLWKDIGKEGQQMKHDCKLALGNEGRIIFWEDKRHRENQLCNLFPTLYAITASKGKIIGEVWESSRGEGGWNLRFFRSFNDWEMDEAQRLINPISGRSVRQREEDKISWDVDKKD